MSVRGRWGCMWLLRHFVLESFAKRTSREAPLWKYGDGGLTRHHNIASPASSMLLVLLSP